ncbi:MAG: YihY/virulence factor BrkB family protein [Rhodothermales bacterium]|nr:YihY/virulence factor BrkB family protein [Rhodothermales bacterium]
MTELPGAWNFYRREVIRHLLHKDVFLWAQAIAFKVLVTVVPVALLIILLIFNRSDTFDAFTNLTREFLPSYRTDQLINYVSEFRSIAGRLTIFAGIGLAFTSMTLMTTLRTVLANVFVEEWHGRRSILEGYFFDFLMSVCIGSFLVATISVSAFIQSFHISTSDFMQFFGIENAWVQDSWRTLVRIAGYLIPVILSTAMFYILYWVTPMPRPPAKSVLLGAVVAGILWEVAKYLFTLYAVRLGGTGLLSLLGDTVGLILGFVLWAYYSGLVLIAGALVVVLHEKRRRFILERISRRNEILKRI